MSSGDYDFDYLRFRFLGLAAIVLVGSGVFCLFDLLFLSLGSQTLAVVSDVYEEPRRRGSSTIVEWKFTPPGGTERLGKASGSGVAKGDTIMIQYLPSWLLTSWDSSRPVRPFNWIALSIFFLSTAASGYFGYSAIYQDAPKPKARRR